MHSARCGKTINNQFRKMNKLLIVCCIFSTSFLFAQENYEIQVYASPVMPKGMAIVELHSNFTFNGEKDTVKGVLPSHHAYHGTIEITQGVTKNFELGFYLFTNYSSKYGFRIVG